MEPINKKYDRIRDTINLTKPDKIPVSLSGQGWYYDYAGISRRSVINDPVACANAATKYLDDFELDSSGFTDISITVLQALKSTSYHWAPNGSSVNHAQANDEFAPEDDYPAYIANPFGYRNETALKRRISAFSLPKAEAYECLKEAAKAFKLQMYTNQLTQQIYDEKQVPNLFSAFVSGVIPPFMGPFTQIFDYFRGIKGALIDLRRCPQKVEDACDAYMQQAVAVFGIQSDPAIIKEQIKDTYFSYGMSILNSECFLTADQFEKYYMKYFRKYFTPYFEAGVKFFILGEGDLTRIAEQFADLPKGSICLSLGSNQTEEIATIMRGKQALSAGIHLSDLRYKTKQECLDIAKRNIDNYASDGGFIFSHNSVLMNGTDVKTENIKAVYEFVNEYGKY